MWGSYFFLSDELVKQGRHAQTWLDIASDMGGLIEVFFTILFLLNAFYNETLLFNKFIRTLYFDLDPLKNVVPFKFKTKDSLIAKLCSKAMKLNDKQELYLKGEAKLKEDLNLLMIIQTLYKLKAAITVLVRNLPNDNSAESVKKIREEYFKLVNLKDEFESKKIFKDDIKSFLSRDEKQTLYEKQTKPEFLRRMSQKLSASIIK